MPPVIQVSGSARPTAHGGVDEVSFDVNDGGFFGLIGPNGAGKTNTMECVEGLRTPDRALYRCWVLIPSATFTSCRTVSGSSSSRRNCRSASKSGSGNLWASFTEESDRRRTVLEQLGLIDKRNAWFMTLRAARSTAVHCLALINDPEVVFLDELTTGWTPVAARDLGLVRGIRERGKTVFLTTHVMEEAERLCDR